MLSKEQILDAVKSGRKSATLDGRDYGRLIAFFPEPEWKYFGFELNDGEAAQEPKELTKETVLGLLESDLSFAFSKALTQRGISASLMYETIKMWMWVLDDDLQYFDEYAQYGLPLFKAVAVKYGFDNPIGKDRGDESKYASH